MAGIYLHIPFCAVKCPYCDFYSVPARPAAMDEYLSALLTEIDSAPPGLLAETVYFGGGTPILFGSGRLSTVLKKLRKRLALAKDAEITLEANPFSTPEQEYAALFQAGFNRISFGVQSAIPAELRALGRLQGQEQVKKAVFRAKEAGFQNLSADLMLGIPGQTVTTLRESVEFLDSLNLQHISAYLLKIEKGTPFEKNGFASLCPDEDSQAELYLEAVSLLKKAGFQQYEISNFSKPGYESRHNLKYWRREPYLGFGPAAHSFYRGKRYAHPRSLREYLDTQGQNIILTDPCDNPIEEELMLRLRLTEGVNIATLVPDKNAVYRVLSTARPLEKAGFLQMEKERISLTPKGFLVSNAIILRLAEAISEKEASSNGATSTLP